MRIGVDARALQNNNRFRGIGKLTEYLLIAVAKIQSDHIFVFYIDNSLPKPTHITQLFKKHLIVSVTPNYISKIKYIRAFARPYSKIKPSPNDIDVLLQTDPWNGIPTNIPTIAFFHDLIPMLFKIDDHIKLKGLARIKHEVARHVSEKYYASMLASYSSARMIITISESSKKDYKSYISNSTNPDIRVIYPALIGGRESTKVSRNTFNNLGLAKEQYILYVGGIDLRKNIVQLLKDLKTLRSKGHKVKLVLVGKEFSRKNDLERLGWYNYIKQNPEIKDSIVYAGFVEQADMLYLYKKAVAFVFPSKYEGFGLPILEAMDAECPVVCYENSSIPEVAGDATLMLHDGTPMASSIEKLLTNTDLRNKLIIRGRSQLKKFDWDRSASELLAILTSTS